MVETYGWLDPHSARSRFGVLVVTPEEVAIAGHPHLRAFNVAKKNNAPAINQYKTTIWQ